MWQGQAHLCHANCKRGRQLLVDGLNEIDAFLHEQPDAVVVIIAEDYVPVAALEQALVDSHVRAHLYEHDAEGWPTLGEMVTADSRVVLFSEHTQDGPAWYPYTWRHVRDKPWGPTWVRGFSCTSNRGPVDAPFFLVNHWLSGPSAVRARVGNNALRAHVDNCTQSTGRLPNFIGVDFYDVGPVWDVVGALETAWEQAL